MAQRDPVTSGDAAEVIVGQDPTIQALRAQIRHLAAFDTIGNPHVPTVLLQGETGTGKGLMARCMHGSGPRAQGPFIEVNCAAIPQPLLEAELFGFEAGAFTDAKRAKAGLFEAASAGTLFLDEIDALPLPLQAKLLTVVEEKRIRRLGSVTGRQVDVKLIAATKEDLQKAAAAERFRADLYHRLAVVILALPPLHERQEDIAVLAQFFLRQYAEVHGQRRKQLNAAAVAWLRRYRWPGNVRELRHLMERVTLLHPQVAVDASTLERLCLPPVLPQPQPGADQDERSSQDEAAHIRRALIRTGGNVVRAARLLGLTRSALRYRMQRYGIARQQWEAPMPLESPGAPPVVRRPDTGPRQEKSESFQTPAPGAEQKPVAVLAMTLEFALRPGRQAVPAGLWTAVARWEQVLAEKVRGFGGAIMQRAVSLYVITFGVPQTLEQMPQRAVQAALALRHLATEVQPLAVPGVTPAVRLAVHLGAVLVQDGVGEPTAQLLPVGETLTLPVRLLGHAGAGEVLLSPQVARRVEDLCELQRRRLPLQAGLTKPAEVYAAVRLHPRQALPMRSAGRPLSRFVGRDGELATLHELLARTENAQGQVVGIVGEAGIGKSRLLYEFRRSLTSRRLTYVTARCFAYGRETPYLPILDILRHNCGLSEADSAATITAQVHRGLETAGLAPAEWAPYLLHLLGVPVETERLAALGSRAFKARVFESLLQMSRHGSQQQPLILEVEDVHWIDASSEEFLATLVEQLAGMSLLLLTTYRPGHRPAWSERSYAMQLALSRLSRYDSARVVQEVRRASLVPDHLVQVILVKADGNPFFLEELSRSVLEHADGAPWMVPDTIQAVLAARIDRLPPEAKRLLQVAAVIGKDVTWPLLAAVAEASEEVLQDALASLQEAEFLYETRFFPERVYTFKHVLSQEVASQSLPDSRRRHVHERIARTLTERFPGTAETQPELLAHHYTEAGLTEVAVTYWQQAGERATQRSAYVEAADHLTRGLMLLATLPETPARIETELTLRIALGAALQATKGYGAPEVEQTYARARQLCQHLGDLPRLSWILHGLQAFYYVRAELRTARELGAQLLALAERRPDPVRQVGAHMALGQSLLLMGDLATARTHAAQGERLYRTQQHRFRQAPYVVNPGGSCLQIEAQSLWLLGYPSQALRKSQQALGLAQELAQPYNLAWNLVITALIHQFRREHDAARTYAERVLTLAAEQGFPNWSAWGTVLQGWAVAEAGQVEAGQTHVRQGLAACQRLGSEIGRPLVLGMLAEMCGRAGQAAAGLDLLATALTLIDKSGEGVWEAELHRLRGELLLRQATVQRPRTHAQVALALEAATCLQRALDIARRQHAKSLQLRAAMSLSRLWYRQGKRPQARALLAAVYDWFAEGFETADLQEARALLESLSGSEDLPFPLNLGTEENL
jgi:DNA-binding NtrC family response regulator/predicted ATPase/class 3 adenylate cyclase